MKSLIICSFFLFTSCATIVIKKNIDIGGGLQLLLPQPNEVTSALRAVQVLTVRSKGRVNTFQVIFENQKNNMILAVVTPLWPTPLRAEYNGEQIKVDKKLSANVPFDFRYVLSDIIMVHAPLANLMKWMSNKAQILDTKGQREIAYFSNGVSHKLIQIKYENTDHWQGSLQILNLERQYEIDIKTIKVDYL